MLKMTISSAVFFTDCFPEVARAPASGTRIMESRIDRRSNFRMGRDGFSIEALDTMAPASVATPAV
jgi:hypothetical protein